MGVGHGLELDSPFVSVYVKFKVNALEFSYKVFSFRGFASPPTP